MDWYEERAASEQGRLGIAKAELRFRAVEVIAEALEQSGLSQKQLADRLGVSTGRVSQVLGGDRNLRLNTLAEYLFALGRTARLDTAAAMEGPIQSVEFQVPAQRVQRLDITRLQPPVVAITPTIKSVRVAS